MLQLHLTQIDALAGAVATIEARIGDALGPFRAAVNLLTTMPGLNRTAFTPNFGRIFSTLPARQMQLGVKILF
jgi:hypothetical protein